MAYKDDIKKICKQYKCNAATASVLWKLHELYHEIKNIEREEKKDERS